MKWLIDNFGGNVTLSRRDTFYIYRWDTRSQAAKRFLMKILPYSIGKKPQIELAIEFEDKKEKYLYNLKGSQGFKKLSEEEVSWRVQMQEKLKKAKKNYVLYTKNGTPSTTKRRDTRKSDVIV